MKQTAWRIVKEKYADSAFDGEGARLYPGRWNSAGVRMVYTAESVALAALEILVNLHSGALLAGAYVVIAADFDESLVEVVETADLPADWRSTPAPVQLTRIGDQWIRSAASLALRVPSALVEQERNFLLNPRHPHFDSVTIHRPEPFCWDERLRKRLG